MVGELLHPDPLHSFLNSMVFVPTTAAKLGNVVLHALNPLPLSNLYIRLQVPVPPPASVAPLTVRVCPAHTFALLGDFVAVGIIGSNTTIAVALPEVAVLQSVPDADTKHL